MGRRHVLRSALLALVGLLPVQAVAQVQDQPVHVIMPFAAGGSGDALARLVAGQLQSDFHRPVIVENKTGAAGRIGIEFAKDAAPDGSTLLMTPIAPMSVYPHVYKSLGYDPFRDFQPITQIATFDFGLAVGPEVPARSVAELVAWAKAHPALASYGTPSAGTLPHFFAVMFGRAAGLDLVHAPYRGNGPALADLMGGHISMMFTSSDSLTAPHKAGRIRVLATSGRERSPFLPEVPTFREAGYDIEGTGWFGLFAPANTPAETIGHLNRLVVAAIRRPDVEKRILGLGLHPTGTSPAALAEILRADSALWAPAVKASGFTPEQ